MAVWRCANCAHRTVPENQHPCNVCNGKSHWIYYGDVKPSKKPRPKRVRPCLSDNDLTLLLDWYLSAACIRITPADTQLRDRLRVLKSKLKESRE
jgi:hypothetical protein